MRLILLLLIFFPVFVIGQTEKPMKMKTGAPEYIFLKKVESAIITHDADQLMSYMHPEYKRTQHDEFLEGRTAQFLDEFFFCEGLKFNEITEALLMSYKAVKGNKNEFDVRFYLKTSAVECYCTFLMIRNPETLVLTLYGAVG